MAAPKETEEAEPTRYVLITECLQNDFLLNAECRLSLPEPIVRKVLLGQRRFELKSGQGLRDLPDDAVADGPLGLFLDHAIGRRMRGEDGKGVLHVINIRDWHVPDDNYDFERRRYGAHCEAGTWGAAYVDGLEQWLDPAEHPLESGRARYFEQGSVRIHHVHADSIFDFRPRAEYIEAGTRKYGSAQLEILLDVIIRGSEDDQERARAILREDPQARALLPLEEEIDADSSTRSTARVYVGVIGFYTDIKVAIVLAGLRTRYELPNLAVSDTFTASTTLERHLSGLDFVSKLLNVEVVHGINDLVGFLGGTGDLRDESSIIATDTFSRYQSYFQDRQNVLALETEKLADYELLTQRRSVEVYDTIRSANGFLILFGKVFLATTLVLSVLSAFGVGKWQAAAVTGGLGLAAFVGAFFTQPASDLQRNLTNLAVFKMILESHSLKTAIARFHLTTPQALRELNSSDEATAATRQIDTLRKELEAIEDINRADYEALRRLGFSRDAGTASTTSTTETEVVPAGEPPMSEEPLAEEPPAEPPMAEEPPAEEPMGEESPPAEEPPLAEEPMGEESPPAGEPPPAEEPPMAEEPMGEESPPAEEPPPADAPPAEEPPAEEPKPPKRGR